MRTVQDLRTRQAPSRNWITTLRQRLEILAEAELRPDRCDGHMTYKMNFRQTVKICQTRSGTAVSLHFFGWSVGYLEQIA